MQPARYKTDEVCDMELREFLYLILKDYEAWIYTADWENNKCIEIF
jgi:hypothetical protein